MKCFIWHLVGWKVKIGRKCLEGQWQKVHEKCKEGCYRAECTHSLEHPFRCLDFSQSPAESKIEFIIQRLLKTHFSPQGTHLPSQLVRALTPPLFSSSSRHESPSRHWDRSHLQGTEEEEFPVQGWQTLTFHHRAGYKGGRCSGSFFSLGTHPVQKVFLSSCLGLVHFLLDKAHGHGNWSTHKDVFSLKFPKTMFCHLGPLLSRLADILPGVPAELHLVAWLQLFLTNSIAEILHFYTLVSTPDLSCKCFRSK